VLLRRERPVTSIWRNPGLVDQHRRADTVNQVSDLG
jgi:hypothetical protein